jgi:hypothetical protein
MTDPTRTLVETDDGLTEGLTLLPNTDPAARKAVETYIDAVDDDTVAAELQAWLDRCTDQEIRTDGGTPTTWRRRPDATPTLSVSLLVDTATTTVDTDGEATIQVRPDHGDVRIEAAEDGDRTAEAVLSGSPVAMAALTDELYAAAAAVTDPSGGDRDG